jgi:hypothetical protein
MISEVTNSVLLFAIFVLSDIQIENCNYWSMDSSCTGALVNGQCSSLCGSSGYDCSTMTCSQAQDLWKRAFNYNFNECFNSGYDIKSTCVGDDSSDDNGDNGSNNGGNDNGGDDDDDNDNGDNGSDNGGNDNDGNDNGGDDNDGNDNGGDDDDDNYGVIVMQCRSTNGACEECVEIEIDLASFSTCEESKTFMSRPYAGFEDFNSCFTHITGVDMMLRCSDGGAASSSDNTGMIVGIVIGCIALVAGIVIFVFCMKKRSKL